jgi:hypothetical protein
LIPGREQIRISAQKPPHVTSQRIVSGTARSIDSRSISLERLIELAPPGVEQWVAIADELLQALQSEGAAAGQLRLDAGDIRVTTGGEVEIATRERSPTDSAEDAGVQAVGRLVSEALPLGDESADPIVLVTFQALAMGALGRTPAAAAQGLRSQLAGLTSRDSVAARRDELGAIVDRIRRGSIAVAQPSPAGPPRLRFSRTLVLGAAFATVAVAALVLGLPGASTVLAPAAHSRIQPTQPVAQVPIVAPASIPAVPAPTPTMDVRPPAPAPASAGPLHSVALSTPAPCAPGLRCSGTVTLGFTGGYGSTALAWSVLFYDSCDSQPSTVAKGSFAAPAGWNTVIAQNSFVLAPSAHRGWLVVVTSNPAQAASKAVDVAGPSC